MLFDKKASEIPQFVVVLAIVVVLGAAAVWGILTNIGTQGGSVAFVLGAAAAWAIRTDIGGHGTNVANWINSIAVPTAHP